jgi:large subunit ribosomal protein L9
VKVIFIEDVPNVARVGQTRVVADGYARNFLLPRKLAVQADSHAAAAIDAQLKKKVKQRELEEAEMAKLAEKIDGIEIVLKAKVGENERLYGSVTGADIAEALGKTAGREIDKRKIELAEPIKQVGDSDVTVRFTHEITATIRVRVMSDAAVEEAPSAEEKPAKVAKSGEKAAKAEKAEKAPKKKKAKAEAKAEAAEATPEPVEKTEKAEKAEKKPRARKTKKVEAAVAEPESRPAEGEKES